MHNQNSIRWKSSPPFNQCAYVYVVIGGICAASATARRLVVVAPALAAVAIAVAVRALALALALGVLVCSFHLASLTSLTYLLRIPSLRRIDVLFVRHVAFPSPS